MHLASPVFAHQGMIPSLYTCDGDDVSPPLNWQAPPPKTHSFALVMDDPDAPAGIWVHWVVFNIPASLSALPGNLPKEGNLPDGTRQGRNSWHQSGYGGPCPPGGTHRYYFRFYALDCVLLQDAGISKKELISAMNGHGLAEAQLIGLYRRAG